MKGCKAMKQGGGWTRRGRGTQTDGCGGDGKKQKGLCGDKTMTSTQNTKTHFDFCNMKEEHGPEREALRVKVCKRV